MVEKAGKSPGKELFSAFNLCQENWEHETQLVKMPPYHSFYSKLPLCENKAYLCTRADYLLD